MTSSQISIPFTCLLRLAGKSLSEFLSPNLQGYRRHVNDNGPTILAISIIQAYQGPSTFGISLDKSTLAGSLVANILELSLKI